MHTYLNGHLPKFLKDRAFFTKGNSEFALYIEDAIVYLNWCNQEKIDILGYDCWIQEASNPTIITEESIEGDFHKCLDALRNFDIKSFKKRYVICPVFNIWTK